MGDQMYITEELSKRGQPSVVQLVIYNIDYPKVWPSRKNEKFRNITFSNKRLLIVNGVNGSIKRMLPCSRTNSLYVLEDPIGAQNNGIVHQITPEDRVLFHWRLNTTVNLVINWAVSPSGAFLAVAKGKRIVV